MLKAEDGPEKYAGQYHKERGEEPAGNLVSDLPFAHLPVVINTNAPDNAENCGDHEGEVKGGEKGGVELVLRLLELVKTGFDVARIVLHSFVLLKGNTTRLQVRVKPS